MNNKLYDLYRETMDENRELKLKLARQDCGCCYCKQETEWGICNAFGTATEPHAILFCPMCGKRIS